MAENENADMGALEEQTEMALSEGLVRLPQFAVDKTDPSNYEEKPEATLQDVGQFALESLPVVGEAIAIKDTAEALQEGDYLGAGLNAAAGIVGIVPVVGDVAGKAIKTAGGAMRQVSNEAYDKLVSALDEADDAASWQKNAKSLVTSFRQVDPDIRTPELEESARALRDKKITREQHLENVNAYKPVESWDALPREPSDKATVFSLNSSQREDGKFVLSPDTAESLGVTQSALKIGDRFNGRLDIPAYKAYDTWIVAGRPKGDTATHYAKAIHYKGVGDGPVKFLASQKTGEKIGTGGGKTPYATVSGEVKDLDVEAIREKGAALLNDPEWTQVGFDPRRQSSFYVRGENSKHIPVREAEEVIQIGPLVLAKNAKLDMEYAGYNEGGLSMNEEQMMAALQSAAQSTGAAPDTTVGVDPVSGNDVPMGASPEEVRDDIPAQLSAGEYVVPADVVQYYGVKFFEDLRTSAKMGYDSMQQNGRVGGEPAEEMLPFDISELQVMEEPAPAMQMNVGGLTQRELHNLTGSTSLPNPFRVVTNDDGLSMTVRADEPVPEGFKRLDAENAADTAPESMSFNTDTIDAAIDQYNARNDPTNQVIGALTGLAIPGAGFARGALGLVGSAMEHSRAVETLSDPTATQSDKDKAVSLIDALGFFSRGAAGLTKDDIFDMYGKVVSADKFAGAPGNTTPSDQSAAMGDVGAFGPPGMSGPAPSSGTAPGPGPSASGAEAGFSGDADADAAADYGGIT